MGLPLADGIEDDPELEGVAGADAADVSAPHEGWFGSTGTASAKILSIFGRPGERTTLRAPLSQSPPQGMPRPQPAPASQDLRHGRRERSAPGCSRRASSVAEKRVP